MLELKNSELLVVYGGDCTCKLNSWGFGGFEEYGDCGNKCVATSVLVPMGIAAAGVGVGIAVCWWYPSPCIAISNRIASSIDVSMKLVT